MIHTLYDPEKGAACLYTHDRIGTTEIIEAFGPVARDIDVPGLRADDLLKQFMAWVRDEWPPDWLLVAIPLKRWREDPTVRTVLNIYHEDLNAVWRQFLDVKRKEATKWATHEP